MAELSSAPERAILNDVWNPTAHSLSITTEPGSGGSTSTVSTRSNVVSSASSVTVLAANTARRGATITNDSTAVLYLGFGSGAASTTSYTVQIPAGGYYEVPFGVNEQLTGIWASANGSARVTEIG